MAEKTGLSISFPQTITKVEVFNNEIVKTDTAIVYSKGFNLFGGPNGGIPIPSPHLADIINSNSTLLLTALDTQATSTYSKTYADCTITEAKVVRHTLLKSQWLAATDSHSNFLMSQSNAGTLFDAVLSICNV